MLPMMVSDRGTNRCPRARKTLCASCLASIKSFRSTAECARADASYLCLMVSFAISATPVALVIWKSTISVDGFTLKLASRKMPASRLSLVVIFPSSSPNGAATDLNMNARIRFCHPAFLGRTHLPI